MTVKTYHYQFINSRGDSKVVNLTERGLKVIPKK